MNTPVETHVDGMTCGNCALTITNYLSKAGISDAVANPVTGKVSFSIEDATRLAEIYAGIEKLGYKVKRAEGETASSSFFTLRRMWLISMLCWLPLMGHMFFSWSVLHNPMVQFLLCLPVYVLGTWHFGRSALRSIRNGIPNMDVLIFIGSTAAFFYSIAGWILYPDHVHHYLFFETTASIITLILTGNLLEEITMRQTGASMTALLQYREVKARIVFTDSIGKETIQEVDNQFVKVNDILQVNTGDRIPVDGVLVRGDALVDESMMTGESLPITKQLGDTLVGGTLLTEGALRMQVSAVGESTALWRIIQMVNEAQAAKSPLQRLADKISAIFVPVVIGIALLTFVLSFMVGHLPIQESIMRAVAVLVVACPCAMGLATPAAVMVGMGRAARMGILMKGGDVLQKCGDIRTVVFDKTGTLTTGDLEIADFYTELPEAVFKEIVSTLESHSSHPIAKALTKAWPEQARIDWQSVQEKKGIGMVGVSAEGIRWQIGSYRCLPSAIPEEQRHDIYVLRMGEQVGWIDLKDALRPDVPSLVQGLLAKGMKVVMLSGDRATKCEQVAAEAGISLVHSDCLPEDKLRILKTYMNEQPVAMVGDGINDAPALATASVGISLSDATQIAMQQAGVVLINNQISTLPLALSLGHHTYITIRQNLFWAFFYNVISIPVAALGGLTPGWAAAIMGLSDVILIANSIRLRYKKLS
jgi:Cu+-exporting ATPase